MSESTALVPVPFYPPVRTGTGSFFNFGEQSRRSLPLDRAVRTVAPRPDGAMAYRRDGLFVDPVRIGTRVNLYV